MKIFWKNANEYYIFYDTNRKVRYILFEPQTIDFNMVTLQNFDGLVEITIEEFRSVLDEKFQLKLF